MYTDTNTLLFGTPKNKREPVSRSQKNEVLARQRNKCANCSKRLDMRAVHFDHIKEVYEGGKSKIDNLQALCSICHSIKTNEERRKRTENKRDKKPNNPYDIDVSRFPS